MSQNYFSSDFHLGHANIMKYCNRPFDDVNKMDTKILNNLFKTVHAGDTFYFLGDLSFSIETVKQFLIELQSREIKSFLLIGNHDRKSLDSREVNELANYYSYVKIVRGYMDINIDDQPITLCHFPMFTHNKSHFGAWQLYGHHHVDISDIVQGKKMNVGVDLSQFRPLSFKQIKEYMDKRPDNWDLLRDRKTDQPDMEK